MVTIAVPPLRERREDIALLAERFLGLAAEPGQPTKRLRSDVAAALLKYDWPGNVRELENEIRKMVALTAGPEIDASVCSQHIRDGAHAIPLRPGGAASAAGGAVTVPHAPLKEMIEGLEQQEIRRALTETRNNKSAAAKLLGLSRLGLRKKMERYKISEP